MCFIYIYIFLSLSLCQVPPKSDQFEDSSPLSKVGAKSLCENTSDLGFELSPPYTSGDPTYETIPHHVEMQMTEKYPHDILVHDEDVEEKKEEDNDDPHPYSHHEYHTRSDTAHDKRLTGEDVDEDTDYLVPNVNTSAREGTLLSLHNSPEISSPAYESHLIERKTSKMEESSYERTNVANYDVHITKTPYHFETEHEYAMTMNSGTASQIAKTIDTPEQFWERIGDPLKGSASVVDGEGGNTYCNMKEHMYMELWKSVNPQ